MFFKRNRLGPIMAEDLWEKGYCDQQIADECGVSKRSISGWRRRNHLSGHSTPYKKEEEKRKSTLTEMAVAAKAHGMSYGEYMVARKEGKL